MRERRMRMRCPAHAPGTRLNHQATAIAFVGAVLLLFTLPDLAVANGQEPAAEAIASIESSAGAILEPAVPAFVDSGALAPRVADLGGEFAARGTNSRTRFPADPAAGFTVDDLSVVPLPLARGESAEGRLVGDAAVVYAGTGEAADTVLRPASAGVETFTQIRGPEAPGEYRWRLMLDDDERAALLDDGSIGVFTDAESAAPLPPETPRPPTDLASTEQRIADPAASLEATRSDIAAAGRESDDRLVAHISAPFAWDAEGATVPSRLSVAGDVITLHVEHAGAAYPVQADPVWWGGANLYTGYGDDYPLAAVKAAIDTLYARGLRYVVLVPQMFQWNSANPFDGNPGPALADTKVRYANGQETCNPHQYAAFANHYQQRIVAAGLYARNKPESMTVVIKPHLDVVAVGLDGSKYYVGSRTEIASADSGAWWTSYNCKLIEYAKLADMINPRSTLVVGTELTLMTDDPYDNYRIKGLITGLNAYYPQLDLGYATNWDATVPSQIDDLDSYFFRNGGSTTIDDLDFIGVDAYYNWRDRAGPYRETINGGSIASIMSAWGTTAAEPGDGGSNVCPARVVEDVSGSNPRPVEPNLDNPGIAIECLRRIYAQRVVLSELGYEANSGNGIKAAYYFWNAWTGADGSDPDPRCRWFEGIWLWAAYAGGGSDSFALTPTNLGTAQNFGMGQLTNCP